MGSLGWYAVNSNFNFEKMLLDQLEAQSKEAASADLSRGTDQLLTEAPKFVESGAKPQLAITSEPTGAEIEIDGEFIGNTPTTVTAKQGKVVVKVKKTGFQLWERTLTLNPGDKRNAPCGDGQVTCPSCGIENPPSALYCDCGHEFVPGSKPKEAPPAPPQGAWCPRCKTFNPASHQFCAKCGAAMQKTQKRSSPVAIGCLGLVGIIVLIGMFNSAMVTRAPAHLHTAPRLQPPRQPPHPDTRERT